MITDEEIKTQGMKALVDALGEDQTERFISIIMSEPFDYTEWQQNLWIDKSVKDISNAAMKYRKLKK